ncbi:MAG: hypothetical protein ABI761_15605 [Saprospiraceae bacterium]
MAINIVYPINGGTYPITAPSPGVLKSAYFTASFSVTQGGDDAVDWGFDNSAAIGKSKFYDMISVQQVYKLPGGRHIFWVKSGGSTKSVRFRIGS